MTPINKRTAFDDLEDVFQDMKDVFEDVELPTEEKVIFSPEMTRLIREEIYKEISNIPIGKIVSKIMSNEIERRAKENDSLKESVNTDISKTKEMFDNEIKSMKDSWEGFAGNIRKKYDDLKNEIMTINGKQWFQFGGYSPISNGSLALSSSVSSDYTPSNETVILADASNGNVTVSLPDVASYKNHFYHIKKTDSSSNKVIISGTIDGQSSYEIQIQYDSIKVFSDGSSWYIL